MLTFIRYIEVNFTFVDCVRYKEEFVKSRFCFIHFTVILAGLKKVIPRTSLYRGSLNRGSTVHILFQSAFSIPVIGPLGYNSLHL